MSKMVFLIYPVNFVILNVIIFSHLEARHYTQREREVCTAMRKIMAGLKQLFSFMSKAEDIS